METQARSRTNRLCRVICCASFFCAWPVFAAPTNDNFANAEVISGTNAAIVRVNAGATKEVGEPSHAGNAGGASVWFQWTAPFSGSVEWSTAESSFNTLLTAYEGSSVSNLTSVAANDNDGTNATSRFIFNAISNSTYFLAVDGFNGATGSISLTLTQSMNYFIPANEPRTDFWTTDGRVNSVLETNGTVYLGGSFSYVGRKTVSAAVFNTLDGARVPFPDINGAVTAVAEDRQGGFFVAGTFTRIGDVPVTNFAHIRGNLTVDPDFPALTVSPAGASINGMVTDGLMLYLRGSFTQINGTNRSYVAALDVLTGQLLSWNPAIAAPVSCMTVSGPSIDILSPLGEGIYAAVGATNVVFINKVTAAVTSLAVPFSNSEKNIFALAVLNDSLFIGGNFSTTNPIKMNLVAVNRSFGNLYPGFSPFSLPVVGGIVTALAATCDRIYVAGTFPNIGTTGGGPPGIAHPGFAALDPNTGAALGNVEGGNSVGPMQAAAITVSQNRVWVAGQIPISQTGGLPTISRPLVVFNTFNAVFAGPALPSGIISPTLLGPLPDVAGNVGTMVESGSYILVAGGLITDGSTRYNLAGLDSATGRANFWAPVVSNTVNHLAWSSGRLFAAGTFQRVNGLPRSGFAAFDFPSGQLAQTWIPQAAITNTLGLPQGRQVGVRGGLVYLAGNFTSINGTDRQFLAAVDANNGALAPFNVAVTNANLANGVPAIDVLTVASNQLFLGGNFTQVGGQSRNALAAISLASNAVINAWNPPLAFTNSPGGNIAVTAALPLGNSLFVGGFFHQIGGLHRFGLAELDAASGAVNSWNPLVTSVPPGLSQASLASDGRAIFVGGNFTTAAILRTNIVAFARDGSVADWNPGIVGTPRVHATEEKIFLSESSVLVKNGQVIAPLRVYGFAGAPRITNDLPTQVVLTTNSQLTLSIGVSGQAPLSYQWRRDGTNLAMESGAVFTLSNAQTNDSGSYDVVVSNPLGSVVSAAARVTVTVPASITVQPVSHTVPKGTNVILSVTASGFPAPIFQWRLNGVNIPNARSSTYTVTTNAQPTDGGSYNVIVANAGGAIASDIATVREYGDDYTERQSSGERVRHQYGQWRGGGK
jgi:hypothetical protein